MIKFLDILLTIAHLLLIGFNLFGWIWPATRKAHLICLLVTAGSWIILSPWYGLGYCPLTDWQWQVKEKLGEENLPASFIKYFADKVTGLHYNTDFIDSVTLFSLIGAFILSLYFNFLHRRFLEKNKKY